MLQCPKQLLAQPEKKGWDLESLKFHGSNVVSCIIVSGNKRTPLIGVYLPPSNLDNLPDLEEAIDRFQGADPIIMGDLNADINDLTKVRNQHVSNFLSSFGLLDLLYHFQQPKRHRHRQTWWQHREGETLRSRCDYVLGADRRLFEFVGVRNPRDYSSDHLAIKARLLRSPTKCHNAHLRGRRQFPLALPPNPRAVDTLYQELKEIAPKPPAPLRQPRQQWMSAETLRLINKRAWFRRNPHHNRNVARALTRQLQRSLKDDSRRRAKRAATDIGSCVDGGPDSHPDLQGGYDILKRWYKHSTGRRPKPSRQDLIQQANNFQALHSKELPSPPGNPMPCHVDPYPINDEVPTDEEVQAAVKRLKTNRAGGHSHLRAEHFKEWYQEAHPEKEGVTPIRERWDKLVHIIQHMWTTGEVPTELTWVVLAILPKGQNDTRGVGLIDALQKLVEAIIDARVGEVVRFHDVLHGFCARRGTGTAILEVKLFMELAALEQVPLFILFLDLRKAHDTVDRERALDTFEEYGCGPRMRAVLEALWDHQQIVPRSHGFHGPAFEATRGLTQGGLFSPKLFNIVLDSVIRHWLSLVVPDDGEAAANGLGRRIKDQIGIHYADDGMIGARDHQWLQGATNVLVSLFRRTGMQANAAKSKAMIASTPAIRQSESREAYHRRMTGQGETYRRRLRHRATCPECNKELASGSLLHHRRTAHGVEPDINWNNLPIRQGEIDSISYEVSFPSHANEVACPVPHCPGRAKTRSGLRNHFGRRHPDDELCIVEELFPCPRCERCGHQIPPGQLNNRHYNSESCRQGQERKRQRERLQTMYEADQKVIQVNGIPLEKVSSFVYLGRPVAYNNSDWLAAYRNVKRAQKRWSMVSGVLEKTGASAKARGMFYKAVVQSVLLYGCESWAITDAMRKVLEGFHHRVARRISGLVAQRVGPNEWYYPPIEDALKQAGLWTMREYIFRRHNTIAQQVVGRPIYEWCQETAPVPGSSRFLRWWNQDHSPQEGDEGDVVDDGEAVEVD